MKNAKCAIKSQNGNVQWHQWIESGVWRAFEGQEPRLVDKQETIKCLVKDECSSGVAPTVGSNYFQKKSDHSVPQALIFMLAALSAVCYGRV